ncbi:hypothetical protein NVIE_1087 [Nitrososphaera viennensis EN76]|uniref:Uncharacterized protein n=1 Tax=Nitrososphaera viennensis EN76 TaxID=926571 RepID=A0A060HP00_9ARCH|nr:hypothetical protein NVIE_1087 [Nitrososphaera viennensis EN76]
MVRILAGIGCNLKSFVHSVLLPC